MVLHTKGGDPGCSIANTGFSGKLLTSNCAVDAPGQPMNAGCGIAANSPDFYGDGFNRAGGGVYATEWTDEAITIWHFSRDKVPGDVTGERPDPRGWGMPVARFAGDCDINGHFGPQQIVGLPLTSFCVMSFRVYAYLLRSLILLSAVIGLGIHGVLGVVRPRRIVARILSPIMPAPFRSRFGGSILSRCIRMNELIYRVVWHNGI